MGFLDDHFFKKATSEKRLHVKFGYILLGLLLLVGVAYIYGYMQRKGASDFDNSQGPITNFIPNLSSTYNSIKRGAYAELSISYITLVVSLVISFLVGYLFIKVKLYFLKVIILIRGFIVRKQIVFEDDFVNNNNGWHLKYWEEGNQNEKINKIVDSDMIFEANENEITNQEGRYGAYRDFSLAEGSEYRVVCIVKSIPYTTMKFQLWLHNDGEGKGSTWRLREPENAFTPKNSYQKIITKKFQATHTGFLRIHLEATPGIGKILVDNVKLEKIL